MRRNGAAWLVCGGLGIMTASLAVGAAARTFTEDVAFLQKPFTTDTLITAVHEILQRA